MFKKHENSFKKGEPDEKDGDASSRHSKRKKVSRKKRGRG